MNQQSVVPLPPTGERMIPTLHGARTFWEHVYRYRFAAQFVRGKRVLDVACGEGYGAKGLLLAGAPSVIGVDNDPLACLHARQAYGLDARVGDAADLPVESDSVDVVVSFETIEHVGSPEEFLSECRRVLVPGGRIVVSTPVRGVYPSNNPFHVSEMTREELEGVLGRDFTDIRLFGQVPTWVGPEVGAVFAADAPWFPFRGSDRLRRLLMWVVLGPLAGEPTRRQRRDAPLLISGAREPRLPALSPYLVRDLRTNGPRRPMYLVAVATVRT